MRGSRPMKVAQVPACTAVMMLLFGGLGSGRIWAQSDDIAVLSDEFSEASSVTQWKRHNVVEGWPSQVEVVDVNQSSPGHLYLEPFTSVWFAGFRAPFLFKEISGDFVVTTAVLAQGKKTDSPNEEGSLAGLMLRAPRAGRSETWKLEDESYIYTSRSSAPPAPPRSASRYAGRPSTWTSRPWRARRGSATQP